MTTSPEQPDPDIENLEEETIEETASRLVFGIRNHLNITGTDEDCILMDMTMEAVEHLSSYVDCPMKSYNMPLPVRRAVKMLVATMYEQREAGVPASEALHSDGPVTVFDLISPYRAWCFG